MMQPHTASSDRVRCAVILLLFGIILSFLGIILMIMGWSLDVGSGGAIAGVIVLIVALVLTSIGIYLCYSYRRKLKSNTLPTQPGALISGYAPPGPNYPMGNVSNPQPAYHPVSTYPTGPQVPEQPQPIRYQIYPRHPQPGTGDPPQQRSPGMGYQGDTPDSGIPQSSAANEPPPGSGPPPSYAAVTGEQN